MSPILPPSRHLRVVLLLVLIGGTALRLYAFRGFGGADDAAYAQLANQMATGTFQAGAYDGPAVFPLRIGIIYPTSLLFRAFGVSEWTMVAFPFTLSLLSIPLAYLATTLFFGPTAGVIGAGIWALLPLDTFHASILVPDLPAAFFASLAVVGLVLLQRSALSAARLRFLGGCAIGLALGISWLCKESVVYAAPFFAFLLVRDLRVDWKRHRPIWAGLVVGSLVVITGEMLAYHRATGDWLFHAHETERNYRQYPNAFFLPGSSLAQHATGSYARAVLRRVLYTGPDTILFSLQLLYLPLLAGVVTLRALYWRDRAYLVPGVWCATLVLMFNFAPSSLTSYVPLVLFERYLYPIVLPAVILVAGFLGRLLEPPTGRENRLADRERTFWGVLAVTFLLLAGLYKSYLNLRWNPRWVDEVRELSSVLQPSDRVHADILSIHGLEFFWGYPSRMNVVNFEDLDRVPPIQAGDYVLVNTRYLDWLVSKGGWWPTKRAVYQRPLLAENPPPSWERVWEGGTATLYRAR